MPTSPIRSGWSTTCCSAGSSASGLTIRPGITPRFRRTGTGSLRVRLRRLSSLPSWCSLGSKRLLSSEHFLVDGTLIEAGNLASPIPRSFRPAAKRSGSDWQECAPAHNRLVNGEASCESVGRHDGSKRMKVESYGRFGSNARRDRSHLLGAAGGLTCRRSKRPKTTRSL